jgi:hypothetical protein
MPLDLEERRSVFAWGDRAFAEAAGREGYL